MYDEIISGLTDFIGKSPTAFHAVANLTVYTTARLEGVQEILFTPAGCAALLVVSAGCVLAVHFGGREE